MKAFISTVRGHAARDPHRLAIESTVHHISYCDLVAEMQRVAHYLSQQEFRCIALALENQPAWIAIDLAAICSDIKVVPVPHFFSDQQVEHLLNDSGADCWVSQDNVDPQIDSQSDDNLSIFGASVRVSRLPLSNNNKINLGSKPFKISYTSGTTGTPKGVEIPTSMVEQIIFSLDSVFETEFKSRHISVLPFSLLLENIVGIYAVLNAGGCCIVPSFHELGIIGSSSVEIDKFLDVINRFHPTTMITVPALAQLLVEAASSNPNLIPKSFRYIAVGGAPICHEILRQARSLGIPLYQGYGMTECCSVVSVNTPSHNRDGSVGRVLPHIQINISKENEILIASGIDTRYLHQSAVIPKQWPTGDLGYLDDDQFLYVTGRKLNSYCTAYGRNISPEWVEQVLVDHPEIQQAAIFGEGQTTNVAVIVPAHRHPPRNSLDQTFMAINSELPDYARVNRWITTSEPYSQENRQLLSTGDLHRQKIYDDYRSQIEAQFSRSSG